MPVAMTGCCDCGLIILFICFVQFLALWWPYAPVADASCLCGVGLMHRLQMPVACVMLALGWPGAPVADAGCLCVVGLGVA